MNDHRHHFNNAVLEDWVHKIEDIPPEGLEYERNASEKERAALSRFLSLLACKALSVRYKLMPSTAGKFELEGTLSAHICQSCIITFQSVNAKLDEGLNATFAPPDQMFPTKKQEDQKILTGRTNEPIEQGRIDVGRLCFEILSSSIDPYPKKPGAKLDCQISEACEPGTGDKPGPFAILAQLKGGDLEK